MRVIIDGVAYRWSRVPALENWNTAFSQADEGKGWIEAYKRKGGDAYTQIRSGGERLTVIDEDIPFTSSGAFYVKARANYRVGLRVRVQRGNFWNTGLKRTPAPGRFLRSYSTSLMLPKSDAYIILESGDYLSVDIDGDYADIAQFKVVQGGEVIFNGEAPNSNVDIYIDEVRVLELEQDEVSGPLEEGGQGDLDGDGVPDGLDFDPNDPDIQQPGDVDDDPTGPAGDEPIITNDERGGLEIYVSPNLKPDPFPLLGYIGLAAFFGLILRRPSNG